MRYRLQELQLTDHQAKSVPVVGVNGGRVMGIVRVEWPYAICEWFNDAGERSCGSYSVDALRVLVPLAVVE